VLATVLANAVSRQGMGLTPTGFPIIHLAEHLEVDDGPEAHLRSAEMA
jgi:hypothetical protein